MAENIYWDVVEIRPMAGYKLFIRFKDGLEGEVDLADLINSPEAGIFEQLRDVQKFNQVYVQCGAPAWPADLPPLCPGEPAIIDIDPLNIYKSIKEYGRSLQFAGDGYIQAKE